MRRADKINKIYSDFYNNIIPERVPSSRMFSHYMIAGYADIDMINMHYDYSVLSEKAIQLSKLVKSDSVPFNPIGLSDPRPAKFYQLLGSQNFILSESGFVQHPEVFGMQGNEYAEIIRDPYAFVMEKVIPRQYKNLNPKKPIELWRTIFMSKQALKEDEDSLMGAWMDLFTSGEYYEGPPMGSFGMTEPPVDFIADQLRGFTGISSDLRRHKTEIKEAAEALLPFLFQVGLPSEPHPEGSVILPIHMPTYIREKDFVEVYLPTFVKMTQQYAARGVRCWLGLGNDYTRYVDYLQDLPAATIMYLEKGDPKFYKEKLGNKHILSGMFPLDVIRSGTKQETIDKVKDYLDILAPNGGYVFDFDRQPITFNEIIFENYITMSEAVEELGRYDNAGQLYGQALNSEGYILDESITKKPQSKYLFDWENFKEKNPLVPEFAKETFEGYDYEMMKSIFNLLI